MEALVRQCSRRIQVCLPRVSVTPLGNGEFAHWLASQVERNRDRERIPWGLPCDPVTCIPDSYVDEIIRYSRSEGPLVRALAAHDSQAWARILKVLTARVRTNIHRRQLNCPSLVPPLIEDLVQYCATLIWQRLASYPFDTSFEAWLSKFAYHAVHSWYRSSEARIQLISLEQAQRGARVMDERSTNMLLRAEWRLALESGMVATLTADQSEVIRRQLDGQSDSEIAREMGRSLNAIHKLRQRAIISLRGFLGLTNE